MAIVVKHGSDPTGAIRAGFAAGQGATRNRFREGMLAATDRRKEGERRQEFMSEQSGLDRDWRSDEAEKAEERAISRTRLAADLGRDAREQEFGLREGLADSEQVRRRDDIEWNYTTKQRQDYNRMFDSLEDARESGTFSDDEIKDLELQAYTKLTGLEPVPSIKKRSPYPEGQGIGQSWLSEDGRFLITRDDKGNQKFKDTNSIPTVQDIIEEKKLKLETMKFAREMATVEEKDETGKPLGTEKFDEEKYRAILRKIDSDGKAGDEEETEQPGTGIKIYRDADVY